MLSLGNLSHLTLTMSDGWGHSVALESVRGLQILLVTEGSSGLVGPWPSLKAIPELLDEKPSGFVRLGICLPRPDHMGPHPRIPPHKKVLTPLRIPVSGRGGCLQNQVLQRMISTYEAQCTVCVLCLHLAFDHSNDH